MRENILLLLTILITCFITIDNALQRMFTIEDKEPA